MNEVAGNLVWQRLLNPQETLGFAGLSEKWQCLDIALMVKDYGMLATHPALLQKLRGAIGRVLMGAASKDSLDQKVCPWQPPCANDVFFGPKPMIKLTRHTHEIPKPFTLSAIQKGRDLWLTVSLFGFAREWASEMRSALVRAVRERINWKALAGDMFLPLTMELHVKMIEKTLRLSSKLPDRVILNFVTPIDCKNTDPADHPQSVLSRLVHRVFLLARWHEVQIDTDWKALSHCWRSVIADVDTQKTQIQARHSQRSHSRYTIHSRLVRLDLDGDLAALWPVLVIGEHAHVGRGTTAGLGKYQLRFP